MKHILVVDDSKLNLKVAEDALKETFQVSTARSGLETLDFLKHQKADLILLDIEMPKMNGIETLMKIKLDDTIGNIPVIFLTSIEDRDVEAKCLTLGAQDFIRKPFYKEVMIRRIQRVLELEELRANLEKEVLNKTRELESLTMQSIITFANAIDAKDPYTKGHSIRVAKYSKLIAQKLDWSEIELRNLYYTALLHDIGKIGIPDNILNKKGRLNDEEYAIIKKHPEIGGHILEDVMVIPYLGIGAYNHHERYDGTGYPSGKKGEDIPLVGRIIGIADAVDAMLSNRAYRDKLPIEIVIEEVKKGKNTQFDPMLADIMLDILYSGHILDENETEDTVIKKDNEELLSKLITEYINVSKRDDLTGLWSRSYIETKVDELIKEHNKKLAILMIDLDNFKKVNDNWGHTVGDNILLAVTSAIHNIITKEDIACRIRGDEFIICLTTITTMQDTKKIVLQFIRTIKEKIEILNLPIQISVSIGITMTPEDGSSFHELYLNANKALYQIKRQGKNNYCFYQGLEENIKHSDTQTTFLTIKDLKKLLQEKEIDYKNSYLKNLQKFKKSYQLLYQRIQKTKEPLLIIIFTLEDIRGFSLPKEELEQAMSRLILSVKNLLQTVDIAIKYEQQYIILLKYISKKHLNLMMDHIMNKYDDSKKDPFLKLTYEVEEI